MSPSGHSHTSHMPGLAEKLFIAGSWVDKQRVLIHWTHSAKFGWMSAEYKMSSWRNDGSLWHLVNGGALIGQFWVKDEDMICPHTQLRRWLAAR